MTELENTLSSNNYGITNLLRKGWKRFGWTLAIPRGGRGARGGVGVETAGDF